MLRAYSCGWEEISGKEWTAAIHARMNALALVQGLFSKFMANFVFALSLGALCSLFCTDF